MPAVYDKPLSLTEWPPVQFELKKKGFGGKWLETPLEEMQRNDFFYIDDPDDVPRVRASIQRYREEYAPWALFTVRKLSKYSDTYVCRRLSG